MRTDQFSHASTLRGFVFLIILYLVSFSVECQQLLQSFASRFKYHFFSPIGKYIRICKNSIRIIFNCTPNFYCSSFFWLGVLTLNHVFHAMEESIWAISSSLVASSLAAFVVHYNNKPIHIHRITGVGLILTLIYFYFMVTVNIPMYLDRWKNWEKINIC